MSLLSRVAYRRATLAVRFGDMPLPDVLIAFAACERRGDYSRPCGAGYVDPPGGRGPHLRPGTGRGPRGRQQALRAEAIEGEALTA
jgi:hypothetical protein